MNPDAGPGTAETSPQYFLADDIDAETVIDSLLYEDTGILTDREVRWTLQDIRADTDRLSDDIDRGHTTDVLCRDVIDTCTHLAGLLHVWRQQTSMAASSPTR